MPELDCLRNLLEGIDYNPRLAAISLPLQALDAQNLSADSRLFLELWTRRGHPYLTWGDLYSRRWRDNSQLLEMYRALSPEEKVSILAVATFPLHEYTHHIDLLTTPYGANFHGKTCSEYWWVEQHAAAPVHDLLQSLLADRSRVLAPLRRLLDSAERLSPTEQALAAECWPNWGRLLQFFDIYSGAAPSNALRRGWSDEESAVAQVEILGRQVPTVTVHGWYHTIGPAGASAWVANFISPAAILEARALGNALAWIVHAFPDLEEGAREAVRYFECFYERDEIRYDYLFLLDLMSAAMQGGRKSIHDLLPTLSGLQILKLTGTIGVCCWYALQAMPPTKESPLFMSSPAYRLLIALNQVGGDNASGVKPAATQGETIAAFYKRVDGRHSQNWPAERIYSETLSWLDGHIRLNEREVQHPEMRAHFGKVLGAVRWHLAHRNGYGMPPGLTTAGLPFTFAAEAEYLENLLPDYQPPAAVGSWNILREQVLLKYPTANVVAELRQRFLDRELAIFCSQCGLPAGKRLTDFTLPMTFHCSHCGTEETLDPQDAYWFDEDAPPVGGE